MSARGNIIINANNTHNFNVENAGSNTYNFPD